MNTIHIVKLIAVAAIAIIAVSTFIAKRSAQKSTKKSTPEEVDEPSYAKENLWEQDDDALF